MFEFKDCEISIFVFPNAVLEANDVFDYVNSVNSEFTGSLYEVNKKEVDNE